MNYQMRRGGQEFGPYTLEQIKQYVASGNIVPTDEVLGEGMESWTTVAQLLDAGRVPAPLAFTPDIPPFVPPAPKPAASGPLPPGLHWGIVLLLTFITCGLFGYIWYFVQAFFVKKINPRSNAVILFAVGIALNFISAGVSFVLGFGAAMAGGQTDPSMMFISWGLSLVCLVLLVLGELDMRSSMLAYYNTQEPIGLKLSVVLTVFFALFYLQYHFVRIREWKQTGRVEPQGAVRF